MIYIKRLKRKRKEGRKEEVSRWGEREGEDIKLPILLRVNAPHFLAPSKPFEHVCACGANRTSSALLHRSDKGKDAGCGEDSDSGVFWHRDDVGRPKHIHLE